MKPKRTYRHLRAVLWLCVPVFGVVFYGLAAYALF